MNNVNVLMNDNVSSIKWDNFSQSATYDLRVITICYFLNYQLNLKKQKNLKNLKKPFNRQGLLLDKVFY